MVHSSFVSKSPRVPMEYWLKSPCHPSVTTLPPPGAFVPQGREDRLEGLAGLQRIQAGDNGQNGQSQAHPGQLFALDDILDIGDDVTNIGNLTGARAKPNTELGEQFQEGTACGEISQEHAFQQLGQPW